MTDSILELRNVNFRYPTGLNDTLKNIDFKVRENEKIVLLGNNGVGKSTLFLLMNGILHPNSGEMYLDGQLLTKSKTDTRKLRETVGLIFQDPDSMFIAPTVKEEISFGLYNLGYGDKEVRKKTTDVMELLQIEELNSKAPHQLSGGEKKLVSIASVLVMKPKIILFDEPTAGLDSENAKNLLEVLKILSDEGISLMVSTHDMDFAWSFSERAIILKAGSIISQGESEKLLSDEEVLRIGGLYEPVVAKIGKMLVKDTTSLPKSILELENLIKNIRLK